jgi:methylphosphotriester-DNA--protein-cysteine methyltransferase
MALKVISRAEPANWVMGQSFKALVYSPNLTTLRVPSASTKVAPVEFSCDVRLRRAAQLLAQTILRISEIAFEVGTEDAKYFRKAFQKIYHLTPPDYARQRWPGTSRR